jgi:hypothetical protein
LLFLWLLLWLWLWLWLLLFLWLLLWLWLWLWLWLSAAAMHASIALNKLAIEQAILFYPALNELAVKEPFKHLQLQKLPQALQLGLGHSGPGAVSDSDCATADGQEDSEVSGTGTTSKHMSAASVATSAVTMHDDCKAGCLACEVAYSKAWCNHRATTIGLSRSRRCTSRWLSSAVTQQAIMHA